MVMSKKLQIFFAILTLFTIVFIWGNSIIPAKVSRAISAAITEFFGGQVTVDTEDVIDDEFILRKLAHFSEFLLLGAELTLLYSLHEKSLKNKLRFLFCAAMFFPLMDETIQLFNDRTSMVKDIWIDIAGFTVGCTLMLLVCTVLNHFRNKKKGDRI